MSLLPDAELYLYTDIINEPLAQEIFKLKDNPDFSKRTYGNTHLARKTIVFGSADIVKLKKNPPAIWGDGAVIQEYTPALLELLDTVSLLCKGFTFNVCLANLYESGKDTIAWHSDKEELGDTNCIASVTIGQERMFHFSNKKTGIKTKLLLPHRSMLFMGKGCQETYLHRLPKDNSVNPRLNLTFRNFHYNE